MMCLAVPGKILQCDGDEAEVDMQGNRLHISRVLTPDAAPGDWVLVHAGFSISPLEERDALETWEYLKQSYGAGIARELDLVKPNGVDR
jgi:hydrogenase expression/formation protein HypC